MVERQVETRLKVAVYLPASEKFSPRFGGALATWTYRIYSRLQSDFDIYVVGVPTDEAYEGLAASYVAENQLFAHMHKAISSRELKGKLAGAKQFLRRCYARRVANAIAKFQPDVIHVHNDPDAVSTLRAKNRMVPLVLHMNNDHLIEGCSATEGIAEIAVGLSNAVAFCSEYSRDAALAGVRNLDPNKSFVIHNGAECPQGKVEQLKVGGERESRPVILFAGRIVPQKGLHVLLAALPMVLSHYPTAVLRVVGGINCGSSHTDSYLASLKATAAKLGNAVDFIGPVPQHEVRRYMANADVFVCPSVWPEPFGMVNVEAMAAGVPVVAFARGGIPEAVGDAGVLLDECSAESLSRGICALLGDSALRARYVQRARQRVAERFTWDVIARQWQIRLEQLAGARGTS